MLPLESLFTGTLQLWTRFVINCILVCPTWREVNANSESIPIASSTRYEICTTKRRIYVYAHITYFDIHIYYKSCKGDACLLDQYPIPLWTSRAVLHMLLLSHKCIVTYRNRVYLDESQCFKHFVMADGIKGLLIIYSRDLLYSTHFSISISLTCKWSFVL